jgi:Family of unknown function (DUF5681)
VETRWKPGQSGNPGGRSKGPQRRVRELCGGDGARLPSELALCALPAVEDELIIGVEVGAPPVLVGRQPHLATLGALWDQSDLLRAHGSAVPTPSIGFDPDETSSI